VFSCPHCAFRFPPPLARAGFFGIFAFAKKTELSGLSGVGKVNDFLYRGSQPSAEGDEQLRKLGITVIVDLRGERQARSERSAGAPQRSACAW
jgi:hypothetical protein